MTDLHVDIETYSSIDIKACGAYKYMESPDFQILLISYAYGDEEVKTIDLLSLRLEGKTMAEIIDMPEHKGFFIALGDPTVKKHAHNAVFERKAFETIGFYTSPFQWSCSAVKAAYCGLPRSLAEVSKVLDLTNGKLATGKDLIKFFSCPCKPTKKNEGRTRNLPTDSEENMAKWLDYIYYNKIDVEAEREIEDVLSPYAIPNFEYENYVLDQEINDRGVLINLVMASNAVTIDNAYSAKLENRVRELTGLDNPNSAAQLKKWLSEAFKNDITTLAKDNIPALIDTAPNATVGEVLSLRQKLSKTSTKKYEAMSNWACEDGRARGLLLFYGANRTGRWAGRGIQLQNLPKNFLEDLDTPRNAVIDNDLDLLDLLYSDVSNILSQLIRTALIPKNNHIFAVADFSAIEARVIAWVADEQWRLDVFATHGKIYEASAAMMFNVPVESIGKHDPMRAKGKIAELALGYQGALEALRRMGGEKEGLSDEEMSHIVKVWRKANPNIVKLWSDFDACALEAVRYRKTVKSSHKGICFRADSYALIITLPSGRELFYFKPKIGENQFGNKSIKYMGMEQTKKVWGYMDTYGGKLTENIVQAIARDLLASAMMGLHEAGYNIVMHVHDEAIVEVPLDNSQEALLDMCAIMGEDVSWAKGLPLRADGYLTKYYKKD